MRTWLQHCATAPLTTNEFPSIWRLAIAAVFMQLKICLWSPINLHADVAQFHITKSTFYVYVFVVVVLYYVYEWCPRFGAADRTWIVSTFKLQHLRFDGHAGHTIFEADRLLKSACTLLAPIVFTFNVQMKFEKLYKIMYKMEIVFVAAEKTRKNTDKSPCRSIHTDEEARSMLWGHLITIKPQLHVFVMQFPFY